MSLADAIGVANVHYRAPQAPSGAWYPQSFLAPLEENQAGIEDGLATIQSVIDGLEKAGMPAEQIVLIGFSQGACLASEFAARNPRRYGGVVALSGGLIGNAQLDDGEPPFDKGFEYEGSLDGTPVLLGCSDIDPHIPVERVHETERVLTELEGDVSKRIYRGMGHTVNNDELTAVRSMLARVG